MSTSIFLKAPKTTANGKTYKGRFTCHDVQWTGEPPDLFGTFTITATELADAAESRLLWTDQDVQRGIKPEVSGAARELCLGDGYPDSKKYIFNADNADEMVEKLLYGGKLFLSPLVWNLRPGAFSAYKDDKEHSLYIYEGKIYIPDSHHRQQAIVRAVRLWRDSPGEYGKFNGNREFKIELYFLSKEGEGDYFYDKNQRPTPTARSKAFDLTTDDALSILSKEVIGRSIALEGNVNRVTDRLSGSNPQVITLSTLREMMKTFVASDYLDVTELSGSAGIAAEFYDMLAKHRRELAQLDPAARRLVRENSVVDAAVMMQGYATLMKAYSLDLAKQGPKAARGSWNERLQKLESTNVYKMGRWKGDLFDKSNPLWQATGITKPSRSGTSLTVVNTGATRAECGRILRQLLSVENVPADISFLAAQ